MKRRDFLKTVAAGVATATLGGCGLASAQIDNSQKPNIIIILVDDLGYGGLSGYGCE